MISRRCDATEQLHAEVKGVEHFLERSHTRLPGRRIREVHPRVLFVHLVVARMRGKEKTVKPIVKTQEDSPLFPREELRVREGVVTFRPLDPSSF